MGVMSIREKITKGASIHRVAERLVLEMRGRIPLYKHIAASKLAWIYQISTWDAYAVIQEMDVRKSD